MIGIYFATATIKVLCNMKSNYGNPCLIVFVVGHVSFFHPIDTMVNRFEYRDIRPVPIAIQGIVLYN